MGDSDRTGKVTTLTAAAMMTDLMPLNLLSVGQSARIAEVLGKDEHSHRLREMGLCQGATVRMVQPGASCIVCLGNRKLCFRSGDAFKVMVQPGT